MAICLYVSCIPYHKDCLRLDPGAVSPAANKSRKKAKSAPADDTAAPMEDMDAPADAPAAATA